MKLHEHHNFTDEIEEPPSADDLADAAFLVLAGIGLSVFAFLLGFGACMIIECAKL